MYKCKEIKGIKTIFSQKKDRRKLLCNGLFQTESGIIIVLRCRLDLQKPILRRNNQPR